MPDLKESEERYRRLFETAQDGILILEGISGLIIDANPFLLNLMEYSREDILGKKLWQIGSFKDIAASKRAFETLKRSKYVRYENLPLKTKSGRLAAVEFVSNVYMVGRKKVIQCNIRDISKRKAAEDARRKTEEELTLFVEEASDGIFIADHNGNYIEVNTSGCKMLGYTRDEILKLNMRDLIYLGPAETATDFDELKAGKIILSERAMRRKDGTTVPVETSSKLLPDGRIQDIVRDITERKRAAAENNLLREKAEISSRLATVGEMAAGIAHEINNPLTAVIGFTELLLTENLPPNIQEELEIIGDSSRRVKEIVKRMLTFARQNPPAKITTNINELIDNTLGFRNYVLSTAGIVVIKHLDPELPYAAVDPGQIQQVFLNLLVNAEYSMKKAHGKGTLTVTSGQKDGRIRISFNDDGTGISPENKTKLFHPFFTTKGVDEGTGLGLSLSRSIILEHGGTIEVESEPGKGANFIITLPVTPFEERVPLAAIPVRNKTEAKVKPARFLVVDDEKAIRKLVSQILVKKGHSVDTSGNYEEALLNLKNNSYDVVIMDIRMPGMSGTELYYKITKSRPEYEGKFVFVTGDTSDAAIRSFLEQKNLTYITKPFDRETFLERVQTLL